MASLQGTIEETLSIPERVIASAADPDAWPYYRFYRGTAVGDKYVCVVVKSPNDGRFVLTAYLTDKVKKGAQLWPETR